MRIHKKILDIRRSCLRQLLSLFCTCNHLRSATWFLDYSIIRKVVKRYSSFCRAMFWTSCFCRDTSYTLPLLSDFCRSFLNSAHTLCHLLVILPWALIVGYWAENVYMTEMQYLQGSENFSCLLWFVSLYVLWKQWEREEKTVSVTQTVMSRRAHRQEFLLPCHQKHLFIS